MTSAEGKRLAMVTAFGLVCVLRSGAGLENKRHISSYTERESKHPHVSQTDEMNVLLLGESPCEPFPATTFSQWLPMRMQFTDKCAKRHGSFSEDNTPHWAVCNISIPTVLFLSLKTIYYSLKLVI